MKIKASILPSLFLVLFFLSGCEEVGDKPSLKIDRNPSIGINDSTLSFYDKLASENANHRNSPLSKISKIYEKTATPVPSFLPYSVVVKSDYVDQEMVKLFIFGLIADGGDVSLTIEKRFSVNRDEVISDEIMIEGIKWFFVKFSVIIPRESISLFLKGESNMVLKNENCTKTRSVSWMAGGPVVKKSAEILREKGEYLLRIEKGDVNVISR